MISLQCDIHIHSTREETCVRDTDLACFRYYEKAAAKAQSERPYYTDKSSFTVSRGQKWVLENKRPDRLRSGLKELEDLLADHVVIFSKWRMQHLVQLVLQNGVIVSLHLNKLGDLARIVVDRWLVGRLSDHLTDCWFTSRHMIIVYLESKVTTITFGKPIHNFAKFESLGHQEPRLVTADLISPVGRRLHRRLQMNPEGDLFIVWWSASDQEVYPWTPQLKEEDRANLLLYSLRPEPRPDSRPEPRLLAFYRTRSEPLFFRFLPGTCLHYIGQSQNSGGGGRGEGRLENTVLVLDNDNHLRKKLSRTVSLSHLVICHCLVPNSDSVILGTIDGTILSFDQVENKIDNQVKAGFIPTSLAAHPDGSVVLALGEKGLLQAFDIALSPIQLAFPNEEQLTGNILDISQYFRSGIVVKGGSWSRHEEADQQRHHPDSAAMGFSCCMLRILGGPLTTLRVSAGVLTGGRIGPLQIVGQYLKYNLYHQVLLFLSQISWVYSGEILLTCLSLAFNTFLKLPFTREKECLLEMCLGLFLAPNKNLSEEVREEYAVPIHDLTRRFFHHLIRHDQLVKGFQLAVDINDYDLFMDVHHAASRKGLPDLAQAAFVKAKAAYNRTSSEPGTRCTSSQSIPTPFQIFTGELLQPQSATYLKTTAARKISTNQFRPAEEESIITTPKSLRFESIVSLPYSPIQPPDPVKAARPPPQPPYTATIPTTTTTSPPDPFPYHTSPYLGPQTSSPYIQRSAVAAVDTEQEMRQAGVFELGLSTLSLSSPAARSDPLPTPSRDVVPRRPPEAAGSGGAAAAVRLHYQQQRIGLPVFESLGSRPPATGQSRSLPPTALIAQNHYHHQHQPPPPLHGVGMDRGDQEDIKVIHFGVV